MKLYSGPLSLFTAKVRIALAEKGLGYERIEVGWSRDSAYVPHHPDVVALNPKRQVPVLVDGDVVVTDSTQIFEYLEERHPDPPLYPKQIAERARCRRLEASADEIVFPHVWSIILNRMYGRPARAGEPVDANGSVDEALASLETLYRSLDSELAGGDFLCAEGFSVADIGTFVITSAAGMLGASAPPDCARFAAWSSRIAARPAVQADLQAMTAVAATALAGPAASADAQPSASAP